MGLNVSMIGIVELATILERLTAISENAVSSHKSSHTFQIHSKTNFRFQHIGHKIHPTLAIFIEIQASQAGHCHAETQSITKLPAPY